MRLKLFDVLQGVAILATVAYAYWRLQDRSWTWMNVTGLVLVISSFPLWLLARFQLGRSFAIKARAKELMTHGLYSRIRNPIYVFETAFVAGFFLLIGKPIWLSLVAIIVLMQVIRARKESKVLEDKFGEAYRAYRRKTWF
jgi:protein-S-isoprenylcysteine O-methyltransferase Ste14